MNNSILSTRGLEQVTNFFQPLLSQLADLVADRLRPPIAEAPPVMMTREEVCEALHITKPTLNDWTKKGLLPSVKVGGRRLYRQDDVEMAVRKNLKNQQKRYLR